MDYPTSQMVTDLHDAERDKRQPQDFNVLMILLYPLRKPKAGKIGRFL